MSKRKSDQRWRVSRFRGAKVEVVGIVLAPDQATAIQTAIKGHRIEDLNLR